MTVGITGNGPARESVEQVLADEGIGIDAVEPDEISESDLAVVVDRVGARAFETANEAALSGADTEWIGVELGGVGGEPLDDVDTAVCGFGPETGCFECLASRVAANTDPTERGNTEQSTSRGGSAQSGNVDSATARLAGAIAGRKLLGTLAGVPISGVIELPYAERELLAVPGCRCHDRSASERSRFGSLDREYKDRSLNEAVARAERALDSRLGIVSSIGEASSFPLAYYLASLCDTTSFSDARATPQAAGVAADWDRAFMKGIGEALERYCAGVYRIADLPEARASELDRAISPTVFVRPEAEKTDDEPIQWVAGEALGTGSPVHLPATVVFFPPPEERFRPAITTGLGLGNSTTEALLSGLYEVIERDATMLGWYSTFEPLGLRVESENFETLQRRAGAEDLATTALLVTQDVDVPVVSVAVHREGEWPRFAVGSGADLDATRAAEAALAEAMQNWIELRGMGKESAAESEGAIGQYAAFPPAAQEFVDVDRAIPAAEIGSDVVGTDELEAVIGRLAAADLDSYATRLTTRDVEHLEFEAVRVVVPTAQPLFTGVPFFGERARAVPEGLGFEPRLDRGFHPYP